MNTQEELRELFSRIRDTLGVHWEMGLDPPFVSVDNRPVQEKGASPGGVPGGDVPDCAETLESLMAAMSDCKRCKLHHGRTCLVFGEGPSNAELMFVGEGPGRDEDTSGRPFVGEAGGLLTRIIENGMKLRREDVYICNIVKCRPPDNRDPETDEIAACAPFLNQQIKIINPKVICALGRVAGRNLIGGDFKITRDRGKWFSYEGIPVMPTYHPAYLLRNQSAKREVWADVQQIMVRLGLPVKQ